MFPFQRKSTIVKYRRQFSNGKVPASVWVSFCLVQVILIPQMRLPLPLNMHHTITITIPITIIICKLVVLHITHNTITYTITCHNNSNKHIRHRPALRRQHRISWPRNNINIISNKCKVARVQRMRRPQVGGWRLVHVHVVCINVSRTKSIRKFLIKATYISLLLFSVYPFSFHLIWIHCGSLEETTISDTPNRFTWCSKLNWFIRNLLFVTFVCLSRCCSIFHSYPPITNWNRFLPGEFPLDTSANLSFYHINYIVYIFINE